MAQKIATVSTVFAACDRLNAANARWNREDVRSEVGGGGYVVIDPLIKAWRELKPLREAAPTTPAELLHQIATSVESHITSYISESESRLIESQQVFDTTTSELSERLEALENELQEKGASLQEMAAAKTNLAEQLASSQQSVSDVQKTNTQLVAENDGLRGQVARMETEHKEAAELLHAQASEQAKESARERARVSDEYAAAQANQRRELTAAAEQAENRLVVLLDQERQAAKEAAAQLTEQLAEITNKAQLSREKVVELESTARQLTGVNSVLESNLSKKKGVCQELSDALDEQKAASSFIQREFELYKEEHKLSGELGAIQEAVVALQAKLDEKQIE